MKLKIFGKIELLIVSRYVENVTMMQHREISGKIST